MPHLSRIAVTTITHLSQQLLIRVHKSNKLRYLSLPERLNKVLSRKIQKIHVLIHDGAIHVIRVTQVVTDHCPVQPVVILEVTTLNIVISRNDKFRHDCYTFIGCLLIGSRKL
jgi:hypothetical protein